MVKTFAHNIDETRHDNILISFIVPVFNTAAYLVETLSSIANIGRPDIELIIVDDGSTDESHNVISEWIKIAPMPVHYIRQQNSGLSSARMTGLKQATGEYIAFCDSDDRLNSQTFLKMAELATEHDCDIAICRSVVFDSASGESFDFYDARYWDALLNGQSFVVCSVLRSPEILRLEPNANTRLIKREFFIKNSLSFPRGLHYEDLPVHVESLCRAGKVLLIDRTGYYYRVNRYGKITDQKSERRFDILKVTQLAADNAKNANINKEAFAFLLAMMIRMIFWCGMNTLNKDREAFYRDSSTFIRNEIPYDVVRYAIDNVLGAEEGILLAALWTGSTSLIVRRASQNGTRIKDTVRVVTSRQLGRGARSVAREKIRSRLAIRAS